MQSLRYMIFAATTCFHVFTLPVYFQSNQWKDKERVWLSGQLPQSVLSRLNGMKLYGPPCKKLFVARVFCVDRCPIECGPVSTLNIIQCTVFQGWPRHDPGSFSMSCKCGFNCQTSFYSWSAIEDYFFKTYVNPSVTTASSNYGVTTAANATSVAPNFVLTNILYTASTRVNLAIMAMNGGMLIEPKQQPFEKGSIVKLTSIECNSTDVCTKITYSQDNSSSATVIIHSVTAISNFSIALPGGMTTSMNVTNATDVKLQLNYFFNITATTANGSQVIAPTASRIVRRSVQMIDF